jgi:hypothetical protein
MGGLHAELSVRTFCIFLRELSSRQRRSPALHCAGSLDEVLLFRLGQLSDFPAGVYTLEMEYAHQFNHLPSVGHTITVAITNSPSGKRLSIPSADKEYN